MASAGPSFRIFGIPVRIEPTFLVIAALFGFAAGSVTVLITWVAVLTVSVLLHELGHAVMFRIYGQQPHIVLQGMGGLTWGSAPLAGSRDIVVSLAGPLAGIVLLGLPALALDRSAIELSEIWDLVVRLTVYVNLAWSFVNLLPILPLDGGNVTASILRRRIGEIRGQHVAHKVSIGVAGAAALFAYQAGYPFGAMFALFFIASNYGALKEQKTRDQREPLVEGYRSLLNKDPFGAIAQADTVLAAGPPPELAARAVELKAWARLCSSGAAGAAKVLEDLPEGSTVNAFLRGALALENGRRAEAIDDVAGAYAEGQSGPWSVIVAEALAAHGLVRDLVERLAAFGKDGAEGLVQLQAHLHAAGRYPEAASVGHRAFQAGLEDSALSAYNVACSLACAGQTAEALDWLERAAGAGFTDRNLLDGDPDLEPLRSFDRYQAVRQGLDTT